MWTGAKASYEQAGFELGVDTQMSDTMRVVQFTPPGSACTIVFGTGMPGISDMQPGSVHGLHLGGELRPQGFENASWQGGHGEPRRSG
jgi:hypothetical protein